MGENDACPPPSPNHPSPHTKGRASWCEMAVRAKSGNALRCPLHVNIHFPSALTKIMHEALKEADAGRVTTPGLSHCMLIRYSCVWWLRSCVFCFAFFIYTSLVLVMAAVCLSCNWGQNIFLFCFLLLFPFTQQLVSMLLFVKLFCLWLSSWKFKKSIWKGHSSLLHKLINPSPHSPV